MKTKRKNRLFGWLTLLAVLFLLPFIYYWGRPLPVEMRQDLYPGIVYYRRVHLTPRIMIAHIITVDLTQKNIGVFVTPPDKKDIGAEMPVNARTTSEFAHQFGVQVAVNGDGFTPWHSTNIFDYYPHDGDPVTPNGFAASQGHEYGTGKEPTLYISNRNQATFGAPDHKVYNAISGSTWLVKNRQVVNDLDDARTAPRTAVGLDGPGTRLIIIVVDGRQPLYSEGATIQDLAELMMYYGGDNAILLDGGGSSTMVIQDPVTGQYHVMNSPIDNYLPGRERPVANHLGIFANDK